MENNNLNRQQSFLLKWSTLLVALSLFSLILSLWRGPIFFRYLIVCSVLGLMYGGTLVLDYSKRVPLLGGLGFAVLIIGEHIARDSFIGDTAYRVAKWSILAQFLSIMCLSMFGMARLFHRKADVEQIVGPERGRPLFK
jgi:hypothetical protein